MKPVPGCIVLQESKACTDVPDKSIYTLLVCRVFLFPVVQAFQVSSNARPLDFWKGAVSEQHVHGRL